MRYDFNPSGFPTYVYREHRVKIDFKDNQELIGVYGSIDDRLGYGKFNNFGFIVKEKPSLWITTKHLFKLF